MSDRLDIAERLVEATFAPVKPRQNGDSRYAHSQRVARRLTDPHDKLVALFHDVLEDTGLPEEVISGLFGANVLADVKTLTRPSWLGYVSYIENIAAAGSDTALRVKLADLADNSINTPPELVPRYKRATARLRAELVARMQRDGWKVLGSNDLAFDAPEAIG